LRQTDRQIDAQVYELCGLTEEEIRIVEEPCERFYKFARVRFNT
jgi:hypothetical protein